MDDHTVTIVIATLVAVTVCLVVCQVLICYTSYLEAEREERRRIIVQQKNKKLQNV